MWLVIPAQGKLRMKYCHFTQSKVPTDSKVPTISNLEGIPPVAAIRATRESNRI